MVLRKPLEFFFWLHERWDDLGPVAKAIVIVLVAVSSLAGLFLWYVESQDPKVKERLSDLSVEIEGREALLAADVEEGGDFRGVLRRHLAQADENRTLAGSLRSAYVYFLANERIDDGHWNVRQFDAYRDPERKVTARLRALETGIDEAETFLREASDLEAKLERELSNHTYLAIENRTKAESALADGDMFGGHAAVEAGHAHLLQFDEARLGGQATPGPSAALAVAGAVAGAVLFAMRARRR